MRETPSLVMRHDYVSGTTQVFWSDRPEDKRLVLQADYDTYEEYTEALDAAVDELFEGGES